LYSTAPQKTQGVSGAGMPGVRDSGEPIILDARFGLGTQAHSTALIKET